MSVDPRVSEWGNPAMVMCGHPPVKKNSWLGGYAGK